MITDDPTECNFRPDYCFFYANIGFFKNPSGESSILSVLNTDCGGRKAEELLRKGISGKKSGVKRLLEGWD
jgi:hypothetical protein